MDLAFRFGWGCREMLTEFQFRSVLGRGHSEIGEINIEETELAEDRVQWWTFIGVESQGSNARISWFWWKTMGSK